MEEKYFIYAGISLCLLASAYIINRQRVALKEMDAFLQQSTIVKNRLEKINDKNSDLLDEIKRIFPSK